MILTSKEIMDLCQNDPPLIEELDPDQRSGIEGGAYDLRVDSLYWMRGQGHIYTSSRATPYTGVVEPVPLSSKERTGWILPENSSFLVVTKEAVNLPDDISAMVDSRTTLFRCGRVLITGPVHPGYQGRLTFLLASPGCTGTLELERGARIACIRFMKMVDSETFSYKGVWQGGKVSTNGREERPY